MGEPSQKTGIKKVILRHKKPVVIAVLILAVVIAGAMVLSKTFSSAADTRITTYNVEEISYGNVSTTISGSGTLTPVTLKTLTASYAGEVEKIKVSTGKEVEKGDVLVILSGSGGEQKITAPCDGIIVELPVTAGENVAAGDEVAAVMGKDGFTMEIAVDELDISSVETEQDVSFTIDAVDGEYTGSVKAVSYIGSSSEGTTAYQVTAEVDYIEGVYPGMSASAEIVIEDSGEGLMVPVDAVGTSGDENYVYLAPSDAELGDSYEEEDLDLRALTKVTVETGMSDGSYILIESEDLAEGDLIVITQVTSTLTGSDGDTENGGFGGTDGFPAQGGMDFGDFDFDNFDPGQMPSNGGGSIPGMENWGN